MPAFFIGCETSENMIEFSDNFTYNCWKLDEIEGYICHFKQF